MVHDIASSNTLLTALAEQDLALLTPELETIELPRRKFLHNRGRRIEHVYFLDSGIASVVADGGSKRSVEVGMVGREGVTGLGALMGAERSSYDTFMQIPGAARRLKASRMCELMDQSAPLRHCLLRYAHAFSVQTGQTALVNARSKIEERLARWLVMAHDRVDGDQLQLTHEFLSTMLGVRRAGVTVALGHLEQIGLIKVNRGVITIVDRPALIEHSSGGYGIAEEEMRKITC